MDVEHADLIADGLQIRHLGSLKSQFCNDDHHRLCSGSTGSVRRLHPMFRTKTTEQKADQLFPCLCECHGPFEEYS